MISISRTYSGKSILYDICGFRNKKSQSMLKWGIYMVDFFIMIERKYFSWNSVKAFICSSEKETFSGTTTSLSSLSFVLWIIAIHFPVNSFKGSETRRLYASRFSPSDDLLWNRNSQGKKNHIWDAYSWLAYQLWLQQIHSRNLQISSFTITFNWKSL